MPARSNRRHVFLSSLVLWLASMFLPAVQFHENPGASGAQTITHTGFEMLFFSALFGWFYGNFAFLSNPLLLFGWLFLMQQRYRRAMGWLIATPFLALQTFQLRFVTWHEDEGGVNNSFMTHPVIGWYLWVASLLIPLIAAIHWHRLTKAQAHAPVPPATN